MMPPGLAIAAVMAVLAALILGARAAGRRYGWDPEFSRKSVHVSMGLVCLSFPWMFHEPRPVLLLAVVAVCALAAIRRLSFFRTQFGQVLGGVARESWGELVFPPAVAFVFWLSGGDPLRFCVPVLILAFADAMAALIGKRYGFAKYETDDGWKTLEGSTAFFIVAFISTSVPLWLFSRVGRVECLMISCVMGFILVLIEAIAWRGLDNLFIPVVAYVCLVRMLPLTPLKLGIRLAVLLAIILGLTWWRKSTRLTQSAIIGVALIFYVSWFVGDWHWLIAPVVTVAAYTCLCRQPAVLPHPHTVHAIACIGGVGVCWLSVWQVLGNVHSVYAYGIAYAVNLGMIMLTHFAKRGAFWGLPMALAKAILFSYALFAAPYLVVWHDLPQAIRMAIGALAIVAAATAAFATWQPSIGSAPVDAHRWTRQGIISGIGSGLAFALAMRLKQ
jgi:phytol kinase